MSGSDLREIRAGERDKEARFAYLENQVRDSDPEQLLQLLYEGLIRLLLAGQSDLEEERWEEAAGNLGKARRIVNYLIQLLQPRGGDISRHLRRLYAFCFDRISQSIIQGSPEMLDGVLQVVRELSGAWNELTCKSNEGKV